MHTPFLFDFSKITKPHFIAPPTVIISLSFATHMRFFWKQLATLKEISIISSSYRIQPSARIIPSSFS